MVKRICESSVKNRNVKLKDFCTIAPSNAVVNVYLYNSMNPGKKWDVLEKGVTIDELRHDIGDIWKDYNCDTVMLIDFDDPDSDMSIHID